MPALEFGMRVRVDLAVTQRESVNTRDIRPEDVGTIIRDPDFPERLPMDVSCVQFDRDINGWGPNNTMWGFLPHFLLPLPPSELKKSRTKREGCPRLKEKRSREEC
jgi:hypothetical protein